MSSEIKRRVEAVCAELVLNDGDLRKVMQLLHTEIQKGLGRRTNAEATVKCFPTYVKQLPNGKEQGKFLALDLGGTHFRVLLIELGGNNRAPDGFKMKSKIFTVPQEVMVGHGTGLFDHIAECLAIFVKEHNMSTERLPLGFTFSFPLRQEGLTKARLTTWTKGFNCEGVVGEDVVRMLQEAIARRGDVQITVCAVLNDTTGTLMSCAWLNPNCRIGLIVGTGTNACYVEKLQNVELFDGNTSEPHHVIVNTEWGAFGNNGCLNFLLTEYDREIDAASINPKQQLFEKMISGMYMGELVRLIFVKLIQNGVLFVGQKQEPMSQILQQGSFLTEYISQIESDAPGEYGNCQKILKELGLVGAAAHDYAAVRHICETVSTRAAQLAGAGVACLLAKMDEKSVVVAVDGSVYRYHPHFHDLMTSTIQKLLADKKENIKFDLMLSKDGSGRGAALVAAVASRD